MVQLGVENTWTAYGVGVGQDWIRDRARFKENR